ncbi:MAG: class I adenylate-forming enzyme family protein [bacterium]
MGLLDYLPSGRGESLPNLLSRSIRTVISSGILSNHVSGGLPSVARTALSRGFNVRTIHALQAASNPNRLAIVDDARSVTYRQANSEINQLANSLHKDFGVGEDDPVMIMMENRCEYLLAWFALFRLGAAAVHASYRLSPDELEYQVEHSRSQIIFVSEKSIDAARTLQERYPEYRLKLIALDSVPDAESVYDYETFVSKSSSDFPDIEVPDGAGDNVVYTSGTTGKPKGTVRDMQDQASPADLFRILDALPMNSGERHLVVSPIYHSGGQAFTMIQIALGNTIYLRPGFNAEETLQHLDRWTINSIFMVPTMIRRVLNLPDDLHERYPCNALNCIVSSAAPFPQDLRERAIERFGADAIHDLYGATEIGLITHISGAEMLEKPQSSGRALPGQEIKILGENNNELPPNEIGTVYVYSGQAMSGYLKNEDANDEITEGNWMTVEDMGYLDDDGYLYLTGRAQDMVITGGVNVYPVEIQQRLERHDSVDTAAVFGIPDEEWGEKLAAVIVPNNGSVDFDELEDYAREHLHRAKVPKEWGSRDELPRTDTGKVLKRKLEEDFG